jgi:hypothetical protein
MRLHRSDPAQRTVIEQRRFLWSLTLALAMLAPAAALACRPIKVFNVHFDPNSASVPADEVFRLANWMAELRLRYRNHEAIDVESSVEPQERDHDPLGLSLARGRDVATVLGQNLRVSARIDPPKRGYVVAPSASQKSAERRMRVIGAQLDFLPACPHECPCQQGDPLYEPATK